MVITELEREQAERRMMAEREAGYAMAARYDNQANRIIVSLHTGVEVMIPPHAVEGLHDAEPEQLAEIEITPSGLGLHWPDLDADLYLPGLLQGKLGSARWHAKELGAAGGKTRSETKQNAARFNGLKGGSPRKAQA